MIRNVMIVLLLALALLFVSCAAEVGTDDDPVVVPPNNTTTTEYKDDPVVTTTYEQSEPEEPEYPSPEMDEEGRYLIENASHLMWFSSYVNNSSQALGHSIKALLMNDIDLSQIKDWTPIGMDGFSVFRGEFDGNGHVISGLTVSYTGESGANYVALFGVSHGATIKNLSVSGFEISGNRFVAAICASNGGVIENCSSSASINGTTSLGGICGFNSGSILNCVSYGTVDGSHDMVGGICGYSYNAEIDGCVNYSSVNGDTCVGGISGYADEGVISGCTNEGALVADSYVGGICGRFDSQNSYSFSEGRITLVSGNETGGKLITSVNKAQVSAHTSYAGGICGYSNAYISDCENSGEVTADSNAGGISAEAHYGALFAVTNNGKVTAHSSSAAGILAQSRVPIVMASNTGNIFSSGENAGGISVSVQGGGIYYSMNSAQVSASSRASGICVLSQNALRGCTSLGKITCSDGVSPTAAFALETLGSGFELAQCFTYGDVASVIYPENSMSLNCTVIDKAFVESGALAHTLSEISSDCSETHFWGFFIGESELPVITDDPLLRVYRVREFGTCDKSDLGKEVYSNNSEDIAPDHQPQDGVCTDCGQSVSEN